MTNEKNVACCKILAVDRTVEFPILASYELFSCRREHESVCAMKKKNEKGKVVCSPGLRNRYPGLVRTVRAMHSYLIFKVSSEGHSNQVLLHH